MKKNLLLLLVPFLFLTNVKAEETINVLYENEVLYLYDNNTISIVNPEELNTMYDLNYMYQYLMDKYNSDYKNNYPYYAVRFQNRIDENTEELIFNEMSFYLFSSLPEGTIGNNNTRDYIYYEANNVLTLSEQELNSYTFSEYGNNLLVSDLMPISYNVFDEKWYYNPTYLYDSNFEIENITSYTFNIQSQNLVIGPNDNFTSYKNIENNNYTTVNLDNYEYVLLSLKNYNQSEAFQTNLQVKGQIGITPIYNFGQTSKDSITGSQVQDRCNVSYSDYTIYPFYIIQSDIQNNAIFAVKECSSGSSFKFDNTVFDITYITAQNKENPTITIGGKTYNVIPYEDLPSTATKNEQDNYIPGESGSATDTGGLDSAIKNVQQGLSSLWNTFTYFTDFVGLVFSSLPVELRTILLSAFVVAITIGLIKLFTN